MRIAVITANIGGIDEVIPMVDQSVSCDYFLFTENNLPYPLVSLDSRMRGKYLKINTHRFLSHDVFIWIDGRVEITSPFFVEMMIQKLKGNDVVISKHEYRHNVYEEITWIQDMMKGGNEYLLSRYSHEPFDDELEFYRREGLPQDFPLYMCGIFARWNNEKVNKVFRDWWIGNLEYSCFDQAYFSYVAWKRGLEITGMHHSEMYQYLKIGKHKN